MGKAVAYQTVIHPDLPDGLRNATARVLGTTAAAVKFGIDARGKKTNCAMNDELKEHAFSKRRTRGDKYDRKIVRNYFHHEGTLPDFCSLVEPDKNVRKKWKRKSWSFDGKVTILQCDMRIRKGTKGELAEEYLNSETHATYTCICHGYPFLILMFHLRYISQHPTHSISRAQVEQCICPCIRPDIIKVMNSHPIICELYRLFSCLGMCMSYVHRFQRMYQRAASNSRSTT